VIWHQKQCTVCRNFIPAIPKVFLEIIFRILEDPSITTIVSGIDGMIEQSYHHVCPDCQHTLGLGL